MESLMIHYHIYVCLCHKCTRVQGPKFVVWVAFVRQISGAGPKICSLDGIREFSGLKYTHHHPPQTSRPKVAVRMAFFRARILSEEKTLYIVLPPPSFQLQLSSSLALQLSSSLALALQLSSSSSLALALQLSSSLALALQLQLSSSSSIALQLQLYSL